MAETPRPPPDQDRDPDWGRRRRGTPPPPSFGTTDEGAPPISREPSRRQSDQDRKASDEARLRTEWERVNSEWQRDRGHDQAGQGASSQIPDLSAVFMLLDTLRSAAPVELQERTTALVREVLLTLRSLIDWYLERLDQPAQKPEVQDIPID